ncbi:MAG: hypothetical protein JWO52_2050 [Gammaproteobacteria bacterium]|jgi:putative oxidoreductase|nr:hypothetical protein [Gammaproteobacteria bacterium]
MRRLFSTFARGAPGVGLLLIRLAAGVGLVVSGIEGLRGTLPLGTALMELLTAGLGMLLLAGLWTPITGVLVACGALWKVFSAASPCHWFMLAVLGAALALTGPGAWSIDARLFGWKRLKIPDQHTA